MNILYRLSASKKYIIAHKFISSVIFFAVLGCGWWAYSIFATSENATRYVTATVATSTVISTLSESGTISATSNITVASEASGVVLAIYIQPGTHVAAGTAIAQIDATDAQKLVHDAELSLETAELTYEDSTAPSSSLELLKAKNAVTNAQVALEKAHDNAYSDIANIYTDLSDIILGLDSVLYDSDVSGRSNQTNVDAFGDMVSSKDSSISIFKNSAETSYDEALAAYNESVAKYKATARTASNDELITLAQTTYKATQAVADAVKDSHDFFDRVNTDYSFYSLGTSATLTSLLSSVSGYTTTVNSDLSSALSIRTSIISSEQSLAVAEDDLKTAEEGPDDLARKSATITLKKAQEALADAKATLADTIVHAPFSGTVASIAVDRYQTIGDGTTVATMVSDNEVATLSVSEADVTKIKPGQKATILFDALSDVTIVGTVASISTAGSVSSGVVSYTVDLSLDTTNDSVKPGMSVTADIITDTATGLVVPSSAIKTSGGTTYVLVFDPELEVDSSSGSGTATTHTPNKVIVITGLAGDTETIITSGLVEGQQIVAKTTTSSSSSSSSSKTTTSSNTKSSNVGGPPSGGAMMMGL